MQCTIVYDGFRLAYNVEVNTNVLCSWIYQEITVWHATCTNAQLIKVCSNATVKQTRLVAGCSLLTHQIDRIYAGGFIILYPSYLYDTGVEWRSTSASQARGPRFESRREHSSFSPKSSDFVPVASRGFPWNGAGEN